MKQLPQSKAELKKLLRRVETALASHSPTTNSTTVSTNGMRPLRAVVLDLLDDIQWPTYTRELASYCKARYGREIPPTRFGTLASDEMKSYLAGKRPRMVWLSFALTHDRAEPIKRLWTRSDWPLEWRIVAPTSGRVQFLKLTARLCELAARESATDSEMLRIIAADHARDLPGVQFKRGTFDLEGWKDLALQHLSEVELRDEEIRREAAARWQSKLSGANLLFGMPEMIESDLRTVVYKEGTA